MLKMIVVHFQSPPSEPTICATRFCCEPLLIILDVIIGID